MEDLNQMPLSERLQTLRLRKGLTPGQLAKLSGVSLLTINLYENPYYEQYDIKVLNKLIQCCGARLNITVEIGD